jgi:hypothetical protein
LAKKAISEKGVIPIEKLGMNEELHNEFVSMTKQRKALAKESRKTGSGTCSAFYIEFAVRSQDNGEAASLFPNGFSASARILRVGRVSVFNP